MKISPTVCFSVHPSFFLGMTGNHLLENQTDWQWDRLIGYSHLSLIRGPRPNKMQVIKCSPHPISLRLVQEKGKNTSFKNTFSLKYYVLKSESGTTCLWYTYSSPVYIKYRLTLKI